MCLNVFNVWGYCRSQFSCLWLDSKVGCQIIVDECLRAEEAKLLMAKEKEKVRVMHDPRRQLFCCSPKQFCSRGCVLAPAAVASFLPILS